MVKWGEALEQRLLWSASAISESSGPSGIQRGVIFPAPTLAAKASAQSLAPAGNASVAAPTFTVSGTLFIDENQNGVMDGDEQYSDNFMNGWIIWADTNFNGHWDPNDVYTISEYHGSPARYTLTLPADGQTYRVRLDNEEASFREFTTAEYFDLSSTTPGQALIGYNFGLTPTAYIGGIAFEDSNANGHYDAGEPGITDRTFYLDYNNNGQYDADTEGYSGYVFDGGFFAFPNLGRGTYHLRQVLPPGVTYTTPPLDVTVTPGQTVVNLYMGTSPAVVTDPPPAPAWLSVSPDAVYSLANHRLLVVSGVVTFTADAGASDPALDVQLQNTAHAQFNTSQHLNSLRQYTGASSTLMPGGDKLIRVNDLWIEYPSWFDLNDNALIYDNDGPYSRTYEIKSSVAAGYNGGTWAGTGLRSAMAAAHPGMAIGYIDAVNYKKLYGNAATFRGETFDNTTTLVRYTRAGDADLNGRVDFNDFLRLQNAFGIGSDFSFGDFNYDDFTTFADFLILQNNFGQSA